MKLIAALIASLLLTATYTTISNDINSISANNRRFAPQTSTSTPLQVPVTEWAKGSTLSVQVPVVIACDLSLWRHVYNPSRLVRKGCLTVTGTMVDATKGRQKDGCR